MKDENKGGFLFYFFIPVIMFLLLWATSYAAVDTSDTFYIPQETSLREDATWYRWDTSTVSTYSTNWGSYSNYATPNGYTKYVSSPNIDGEIEKIEILIADQIATPTSFVIENLSTSEGLPIIFGDTNATEFTIPVERPVIEPASFTIGFVSGPINLRFNTGTTSTSGTIRIYYRPLK